MPRIEGLSNEQSAFLRAFRRSAAGPPSQRWPSPTVLRRWLAKPAFRRAITEIREAMEFQTRFHLTSASTHAAYALAAPSDDRKSPSPSSVAAIAAGASSRERAVDLLHLIDRRLNR